MLMDWTNYSAGFEHLTCNQKTKPLLHIYTIPGICIPSFSFVLPVVFEKKPGHGSEKIIIISKKQNNNNKSSRTSLRGDLIIIIIKIIIIITQ